MPQNKSATEEFGAAFYGKGKRAAVVDITDKLFGGKAEPKKSFRMQAKDGVGEIFIYDDIGSGFFSDGVTPKSFAEDLKALGAVRTLNIFINSPGGSVFDGVSIYNQIKRHKARKNVFIDGIAASIASVIAMAGDEINIAANGFMMIHEPWSCACGNASDLRRTADQLDKINDSILNTYAERTPTPENVIADMMEAETWMNAEEAVELGFADKITEEVAIAARFDLSKFANVPEGVAAKLDLAKNPPKIVKDGLQAVTFGKDNDTGKIYVLGEWPEQTAVSSELLISTMQGVEVNEGCLKITCENGTAEYVENGESIFGNSVWRLVASTYEHQPWPLEQANPDDQPRTPALAITKMRQRIQRMGIARKSENNDQTAA